MLFKHQAALTRIRSGWYLSKHSPVKHPCPRQEVWYGVKRRYGEKWRCMVRSGGMVRNAPHSAVAAWKADNRALAEFIAHLQCTLAFHCSVKAPGSGSLSCRISPSYPCLLGGQLGRGLWVYCTVWPLFHMRFCLLIGSFAPCAAPYTSLCCGDHPCCSSRDASWPTAAPLCFHLHLRHHLGF